MVDAESETDCLQLGSGRAIDVLEGCRGLGQNYAGSGRGVGDNKGNLGSDCRTLPGLALPKPEVQGGAARSVVCTGCLGNGGVRAPEVFVDWLPYKLANYTVGMWTVH